MAKRVTISGLTVREAQIALLDAVNEGVLYHVIFFNDGSARTEFNDGKVGVFLVQEESDIIMQDYSTMESAPTAWRVTEGILRLAAAAKRNASK